jgi:hypothetical protein
MGSSDPTEYRDSAERCRGRSSLSAESREWSRISRGWERLAEIAESLSAKTYTLDGSHTLESSGNCENSRKSLLLAGVFCSRNKPSFRCNPLSCETTELARRPLARDSTRASNV